MRIKIENKEGKLLVEATSKNVNLYKRGGIQEPKLVTHRWLDPTLYYNPKYHRAVVID